MCYYHYTKYIVPVLSNSNTCLACKLSLSFLYLAPSFIKRQQGSDTSPRFVTSPQATLLCLRPPHSCLYFDVFGGGGCKQMDEFWNILNIFFGIIDAKLLYWGPDWERMAVVTLGSGQRKIIVRSTSHHILRIFLKYWSLDIFWLTNLFSITSVLWTLS